MGRGERCRRIVRVAEANHEETPYLSLRLLRHQARHSQGRRMPLVPLGDIGMSDTYKGSVLERLDNLVHELTGDEGEDDSFTVLRRRWVDRENDLAEARQALQSETVLLDLVAKERDMLAAKNAALREALQVTIDDGECYCLSEVATRGTCGWCAARAALAGGPLPVKGVSLDAFKDAWEVYQGDFLQAADFDKEHGGAYIITHDDYERIRRKVNAVIGAAMKPCHAADTEPRLRSPKCPACGYVESHDPNCPRPEARDEYSTVHGQEPKA